MDNNRDNNYYDLDSMNNRNIKPEDGNGKKGSFVSGVIAGLAGALLILSVIYLGTRLQQLAGAGRDSDGASMLAQLLSGDSLVD